jgi:hypothetical protein
MRNPLERNPAVVYRVVTMPTREASYSVEAQLDSYGASGWRLVSTVLILDQIQYYFMKEER